MPDSSPTSTRPYLIRALYEWCTDNGFTPYIAVLADDTVQVPREYVQDGQIVLNISVGATSALALDNDYIRFAARFNGMAREIIIPVDRVLAIYARENGQGMAFPAPEAETPGETHVKPAEVHFSPYATAGGHNPLTAGKDSDDAPGSGIRLVSTAPDAPEEGDDDKPPPSSPPPRPALKRIK